VTKPAGVLGPIEIRRATVDAVDYPERTVSLIVAPYDEWTVVEHRGQMLEESIAPGAFGAIRNRARRFLVNMEHDDTRWVGTVLDLDPDDTAGLRATIKIRRNAEGDQALDDAADDLLGASIGMAVAPADQTVENRRRRIRKAYLDHIALTATPAYVGARVLEVRHVLDHPVAASVTATPNLDQILAERLARGYGFGLT
jgi:HK97 family phage prohead protease